jgi:TolB protein
MRTLRVRLQAMAWAGGALLLGSALATPRLGAQTPKSLTDAAPFQAKPTLMFPSLSHSGAQAPSDDAKQFRLTALRDLKESGVFHLLTQAATPGGTEVPGLIPGTQLMLRFASHSMAQGKLLIESECVNVATGAVVLKKSFLGQTAAVDRMAHRLVDFLVDRVTGTPGVADSRIVFSRATAPGIQEIFEADGDGRNPRQLTSFGSLTTHPAIAGDGRLAFVTYKGGPPQVWGQVQAKGPFLLMHPKGSPAGMAISDLAWSPDGRRLCFVQESRKGLKDIHVLDLASGQVTALTETGHASWNPCWNQDGSSIAYLSDREGAPQVFVMASDGSRVRRLTGDSAPKTSVAWNAKGDRIAYSVKSEAGADLITVAADGGNPRQAASIPGPVTSLCWAPDGRSLLVGLGNGADNRFRIATLDGKLRDLDSELNGKFPQWVQNPNPGVARRANAAPAPFPVPALVGAAPLPQ